jgi:hypothetical protein
VLAPAQHQQAAASINSQHSHYFETLMDGILQLVTKALAAPLSAHYDEKMQHCKMTSD